jgi:hypothetical protein
VSPSLPLALKSHYDFVLSVRSPLKHKPQHNHKGAKLKFEHWV